MHRSAEVGYEHRSLDDGDSISLGNVVLDIRATPGHTPESISVLISDRSRAAEPWMVLTGDTLFCGDVGRPDFGGPDAAAILYDSLHEKLLTLPDYVEVYPAHISGSPCGRSMSGKPSSTIGYERRYNTALQAPTKSAFVEAVLRDLPEKPPRYLETIALNRS